MTPEKVRIAYDSWANTIPGEFELPHISEAFEAGYNAALASQPVPAKPHCATCGKDVAEVQCPECGKWWADNQPVPASSDLVEQMVPALRKALESQVISNSLYWAFERGEPIKAETLELIAYAIATAIRERNGSD